MIVQYLKLVLTKKVDRTFAAHAILVKSGRTFSIIVKGDSGLPYRQDCDCGCLEIAGVKFQRRNERAIYVYPLTADIIDSFDTVLIRERRNIQSILHEYNVGVIGNICEANNGDRVYFEDLFDAVPETAGGESVLINTNYTTMEIYSGFGSYHSFQHRPFNTPLNNEFPWRIGVELEVYAKSESDKDVICRSQTNWFQCERDGSLRETINGVGDLGIELKTIPLRPADAKSVDFWDKPAKKLCEHAVSSGHRTCGLHVHISKEVLGTTESERQNNLSKLCTFYTYYVEDDPAARRTNTLICGREKGYAGTLENAKTEISEFCKKFGLNKIADDEDAYMEMAGGVKNAIGAQRWDINTQHMDDYGTIEFRRGAGCIGKMRLAALCAYWEQMCLYCKDTHPGDFSYEQFLEKACRDYPAIAYYAHRVLDES